MIYKQFGINNDVSVLGLGTMRLPLKPDGKVDLNKSISLIREAIDLGINYIDTAPGYSNQFNELVVGLALTNGYRNKTYLSTKTNIGISYDDWMRSFENTLTKLNVSYVDYHMMWCMNLESYKYALNLKHGPIQAADWAKKNGLIKHLGFSSHDTVENIKWIINNGNFETVLLQYNLLDSSNESALRYAKLRGLSTAVMGPLAGGWLARKIPLIENVNPNYKSNVTKLALHFVTSNPYVDIVLSGLENKLALNDTVAYISSENKLNIDEIKHIKTMLKDHNILSDLYCTGCEYCKPCPNNVAISKIFKLYNYYKIYNLTEYCKNKYNEIGTVLDPRINKANLCTNCGACERRCPQKIPIMNKLKEAHNMLS